MSESGSITTSDGVTLGYRRVGAGPPLLLVHGGATDHRCFDPILDLVARHYTVTAYDRRGRGMSGDGPDYSLDREAADVVEMARVTGGDEPVALIAYSYGALAALRAVTTRRVPVRSLVAYEAPLGVPGVIPAAGEVIALVDAGRYDEAIRLFVSSTFHLSDGVVNAMTAHPMWQVSLAAAPTAPRELTAALAARLDPPAVPVPPVRYLVAEEGGNPAFREVAALVQGTIAGADVATVPGLPHFAMATEPAAFVSRALEHLQRHA
ncbi:MAG: alpha/beta fold hydrolase [Acidimicrobiales bacterium]